MARTRYVRPIHLVPSQYVRPLTTFRPHESAHFPVDPCLQAEAGNVTDKIDGKWQEFVFAAGPNQVAFPCISPEWNCSTDPGSEELGVNIPPWTVKSSASCLLLEVMEGYGGGEAVLEVFNAEVSMGKTTDVPLAEGSSSCQANPFGCYFDSGVGKGKFTLRENVQYEIRIIARRSEYPNHFDGGWFRLKKTPCGCAGVREKCSRAKDCCDGLVCRRKKPRGPRKCRKCARANRFCVKDANCCSKSCLVRTSTNGTRTRQCGP